jgi:hypothetical protein
MTCHSIDWDDANYNGWNDMPWVFIKSTACLEQHKERLEAYHEINDCEKSANTTLSDIILHGRILDECLKLETLTITRSCGTCPLMTWSHISVIQIC